MAYINRKIFLWELIGIVFVVVLGSIFHFVFEWLNFWPPIGGFFPVNESVWEHLKLVYWPIVIFSIIEYFPLKKKANNCLLAKFLAIIVACLTIVIFFYAYTAILGEDLLIFDILSFVLGIVLGFLVSYKILTLKELPQWSMVISLISLILVGFIFILFTYYPPELPIFQDPISGLYGIIIHIH